MKVISKLAIIALTAVSTITVAAPGFAQSYYRQEQDRERAARDRRELRNEQAERNAAARRLQNDRIRERNAEARGNYGAARYYARKEDRDARVLRREQRDVNQDRARLQRDRARCARDGTYC